MAASSSYQGGDGDPSGCANAYTVRSVPIYGQRGVTAGRQIGVLELRYSASCRANWSRVVLYQQTFSSPSPILIRQDLNTEGRWTTTSDFGLSVQNGAVSAWGRYIRLKNVNSTACVQTWISSRLRHAQLPHGRRSAVRLRKGSNMKKSNLRKGIVTVAAIASAFLVIIGAAPAFASGYGYNGTNPLSTGCASSGTVVADFPINRTSNGASRDRARHVLDGMRHELGGRRQLGLGCDRDQVHRSRISVVPGGAEFDTVTGWSFGMQAYGPGRRASRSKGR